MHVVYAKSYYPTKTTALPEVAFAIQIRWQSSDSSALGSFYVPSSVVASILQRSGSASGTSKPTAQAASADIASGSSQSNSLPAGIIALIVCVCVGVSLVALSAWFVFRRKRKQRTTRETGPPELPPRPQKNWKGAELPAAVFKPDPEELPAGVVASSAPAGWGSPVQDTPELPPRPQKSWKGAELPAAVFKPDPEELPAGVVASSTPAGWGSPVQHTPELYESSVPASTEMPGPQETQATAGMSSRAVAPQQPPNNLTETVEDLIARQGRLEEKRQRLLQLQQIDEEQERIRRQLVALHDQQPIQRSEMP